MIFWIDRTPFIMGPIFGQKWPPHKKIAKNKGGFYSSFFFNLASSAHEQTSLNLSNFHLLASGHEQYISGQFGRFQIVVQILGPNWIWLYFHNLQVKIYNQPKFEAKRPLLSKNSQISWIHPFELIHQRIQILNPIAPDLEGGTICPPSPSIVWSHLQHQKMS